jgi:hypothetical protein
MNVRQKEISMPDLNAKQLEISMLGCRRSKRRTAGDLNAGQQEI